MSREGTHVEGDLYLDITDQQITLKKYTGNFNEDGKEGTISLGFYNDLEGVARKLYKLKLAQTTATNLQELVKDHKRIINEISEQFELKGLVK